MLVTGGAGFVGAAVAARLLARGDEVLNLDSLNGYYDPRLKQARLVPLLAREGHRFERLDVADDDTLRRVADEFRPEAIVHLAAQPGVRYSLENPGAYSRANLVGFTNVLELARAHRVRHLVYASSSSVYGLNARTPFRVEDRADHPVSFYAATKRANELMAHSYAHLFALPVTGLRFFTVYGPWGRPDMAPMLFASAILEGRPIKLFNEGRMRRDFTYVDDVADGVVRVLDLPPAPDPAWDPTEDPAGSSAPARILNIGHSEPVELLRFVEILERELGRPATKEYLPMQPGDVVATNSDVSALEKLTGWHPTTDIETGLAHFAQWFRTYDAG